MRNATIASFTLAILLGCSFKSMAQEAPAPEKTPLQVVDESIRAIQAGDFATYVDHLSEEEQKVQAGFALLLWATVSPSVEGTFKPIYPQDLLLLRALNDVAIKHSALAADDDASPTAQAMHLATKIQSLLSAPAEYGPSGYAATYATSQTTESARVYDLIRKTSATLSDPRGFLIDVLTEVSRPTQIDGVESTSPQSLNLAELAKAYQQQSWSLYVRGDYAVAASEIALTENAPQSPATIEDGPLTPQPHQATPAAPRIEFQKIAGVWKISHVAPISGLAGFTGWTSQACYGAQYETATWASQSPSYAPSTEYPPSDTPPLPVPAPLR